MAKGKKGKGRHNDDWSDEEPAATKQTADVVDGPGSKSLSRKQQKLAKQQQKAQQQLPSKSKQNNKDSDDDDDDNNEKVFALSGGSRKKQMTSQESDEESSDEDSPKQGTKAKTYKKKQQKRTTAKFESSDSEEGDVMLMSTSKGVLTKKTSSRSNMYTMTDTSDDSEVGGSEAEIPFPEPNHTSQNRNNAFGMMEDSEEELDKKKQMSASNFATLVDPDERNIRNTFATMDDSDDEPVEQIAVTMLDDEPKKAKKDKKDKKEKKVKKEKKEKEHDGSDEDSDEKKKKKKKDKKKEKDKDKKKDKKKEKKDVDDECIDVPVNEAAEVVIEEVVKEVTNLFQETTIEEKKVVVEPSRKKSKFELQMEEALKKKEHMALEEQKAKQEAAIKIAEKAKKKELEAIRKIDEEERAIQEANEIRKKMEEDLEVFYGAPDDVAWTDKSHAQREADENEGEEVDRTLTHGEDGKKLSNKERKRLAKEREKEIREAEYEVAAAKASKEGAQFACSQTAVNEKDPQWENALDITVPNFSISAAGKILFKDAALGISHGRRYGLVGPNGRGKSTLLKMIASGDLKIPPRIDFLYVEQEVVADDTPAVDAVLKADIKRWSLLEEEKKLMAALDAGDEDEKKLDRLQQVTEELSNMGADAMDAKARRILFGLGFDMEMQTKPTKMFSGGWRMRISLARALFVEPTLLMLDEPTNHLDLNAVIWLDDYLQRWKKTMLVVSHDQDFLNSVCQEILHIEDLKLISYKGNYDTFKKAEKVKQIQALKAWEKQEKRLRELKKSGNSKAKATESVKNNNKREPGARSKRQTNDAIAGGTETAKLAELLSRPQEYTVKLEFAEVAELARPVMEVNRVHFRYSVKHPIIFDEIDFGIDMNSRLCVVGPNGAGKSTLLKLLTGEITATKGDVKRNPRLRMGIYNQHFVDRLPMNVSPVEHLRNRFQDEDYQSIRNRLGRYGLEGHAHEVVMRDLSGGQKARVVFVELSLQRPHILLLDEPTNNLDIETIDALCDAINAFNGGIVVVTHDQRLIEECNCDLWVVEKQGVTKWEAGFDDYKETLLRLMEEEVARESASRLRKLQANAVIKADKLARLTSKLKA